MWVSWYEPANRGLVHGIIRLIHANFAVIDSGPDSYTISLDRLILRG